MEFQKKITFTASLLIFAIASNISHLDCRYNIAYGCVGSTQDQVEEAAKMAEIHHTIKGNVSVC